MHVLTVVLPAAPFCVSWCDTDLGLCLRHSLGRVVWDYEDRRVLVALLLSALAQDRDQRALHIWTGKPGWLANLDAHGTGLCHDHDVLF